MAEKLKFPKAMAAALVDAGVKVVTHVPGFGASETFDAYRELSKSAAPVSYHEEVSFAIAHGASLVGTRSATLIKAHGFAKACNAVVDAAVAGSFAGFLIIVFDDSVARHSDCVMDSQSLVDATGLPCRRLDPENAYAEVLDAITDSERRETPVVLIADSDAMTAVSSRSRRPPAPSPRPFERDIAARVLCPPLAAYQDQAGTTRRSGGDWRRLARPTLPTFPKGFPPIWRAAVDVYAPVFEVFKETRGRVVFSDTGVVALSAFSPYDCVDVCCYMGCGPAMAVGAAMAGYPDVWALTGDFCFFAAGQLGFYEAIQRHLPVRVLMFRNGKAATTGGQPIDQAIFDRLLAAFEPYVLELDIAAPETALREANAVSDHPVLAIADFRD